MALTRVIHVGAGKHPRNHDAHFKALLKAAVRAESLAESARVVEHCVSTNTGKGSSLDLLGNATSDCTVIEVEGWRIKSQCTVVNIQNQRLPTQFTRALCSWLDTKYGEDTLSKELGLSRAIALEYKSVKQLFQGETNEMAQWFSCDDSLVLTKAQKDYSVFKGFMEEYGKENKTVPGMSSEDSKGTVPLGVQDTIGVVELTSMPGGSIAMATSSGGNFYRIPGRISCAGISGSGIAYGSYEEIETCCMCSGNGDAIIQLGLASYLCDSIAEELARSDDWPDLGECVVERVLRRGKRLSAPLYLGLILVIRSKRGSHLVYCHSTETFYFAFQQHGASEVVLSQNPTRGKFLHGEYKLR